MTFALTRIESTASTYYSTKCYVISPAPLAHDVHPQGFQNKHLPQSERAQAMRRVALILTVLGILGVAASQVQAHDFYHHGGYYGRYYGSYYGPVVVRPPVYYAPRVVVPVPVAPRAYYPPACGYRCYTPYPYYGFYYQSRGLSIGIGF
jgi:hypothetical protein